MPVEPEVVDRFVVMSERPRISMAKRASTVNKIQMREYRIQELELGVALQAVLGLDE
jgi:hypothetical protein